MCPHQVTKEKLWAENAKENVESFDSIQKVKIQARIFILQRFLNNSTICSLYFQSFCTNLIYFIFPIITFPLPRSRFQELCQGSSPQLLLMSTPQVCACVHACCQFLVLDSSFCYLGDFSPKMMFSITRFPCMAPLFLEVDERYWLSYETLMLGINGKCPVLFKIGNR